jgi:hypothetical protein
MNIELDEEMKDTIVCEALKQLYFELLNREEGEFAIYSWDPIEESKKLAKMRRSIKRVHNWYAVPSEHL